MARENFLKAIEFEHAGLDELKNARFVLGAACLKRNGCDVLGGKDTCKRSVHVLFRCSR